LVVPVVVLLVVVLVVVLVLALVVVTVMDGAGGRSSGCDVCALAIEMENKVANANSEKRFLKRCFKQLAESGTPVMCTALVG
jgi:hypothetical protein